MKTTARLRTKYGGMLEDIEIENFKVDKSGWQFISAFTKVSKEIKNRFSMIYIPDGGKDYS